MAVTSWSGVANNVNEAGTHAYGTGAIPLPTLIGNILNIALSLIGLVFLIYAVYGGYLWLTARGDDKQVTQAKETIKNVIIGIAITVSAYTLTNYIVGSAFIASGNDFGDTSTATSTP